MENLLLNILWKYSASPHIKNKTNDFHSDYVFSNFSWIFYSGQLEKIDLKTIYIGKEEVKLSLSSMI